MPINSLLQTRRRPMKIIRKNRRQHIITPWLSAKEAAAYCGVSKETFRRICKNIVPCPSSGGNEHNRRYYAPVVSEWWEKIHELEQIRGNPYWRKPE